MNLKRILAISSILTCSMMLAACSGSKSTTTTDTSTEASSELSTDTASTEVSEEATTEQDFAGPKGGGPGAGGGMIDKSDDADLQAMIKETESKYQQIDYTDSETGLTFSYNLFVPENYDASTAYPLVLFITDSSVVGNDTTAALTQGYGGIIWASDEDQAKHPNIVVAPEYPENILDGESGATDYVTATINLLSELQSTYSIDADRLYMTGQSMGCMTALYMNATYPDLFAASLYVDGQWPVDVLSPLEDQKFFYFAAEGDEKATEGMENVISMFDTDGVAYGETTVDAKADDSVIESSLQELIDAGNSNNFVHWTEGSVLPDGVENEMANEHMYSFDHAYQVTVVRDWLFEQSK